MKTATQTTLAGVIESLREQIAEAEAAARQCDDEIRHLQGAPAGKDEVLAVVGDLIETLVAEARRPLADALLALSRNSSQLHSPGYIASFVKGQAGLLQRGRHLELDALKPVLIAIAGAESLKRAVAESADRVEWPDALGEADRVRALAAANRKRDGFLATIAELHLQAEELGVEL